MSVRTGAWKKPTWVIWTNTVMFFLLYCIVIHYTVFQCGDPHWPNASIAIIQLYWWMPVGTALCTHCVRSHFHALFQCAPTQSWSQILHALVNSSPTSITHCLSVPPTITHCLKCTPIELMLYFYTAQANSSGKSIINVLPLSADAMPCLRRPTVALFVE